MSQFQPVIGRPIRWFKAIGIAGTRAAMITDGPINATVFTGFVEWLLAASLKPERIVIMDNLSSHKAPAAVEVQRVGAKVIYLPPYSPDLNPIEKLFAKIKALLRAAQARTQQVLYQAIAKALKAVTRSDIQACFRSCGYRVTS